MINDQLLVEAAKAIAVESYVMPAYVVWGSTAITESTTSTTLSGEAFSRNSLTDSRTLNAVSWTGLKTGALAASGGDVIRAAALNSASTSGTHLSEKLLSSILHTTAFDIEIVWTITTSRA